MNKKVIIRYVLTIAFLLLSIWAQSWLLVMVLLIHLFVLWHKPTNNKLNQFLDKVGSKKKNLIAWLMASVYAIIVLLFINTYLFGIYTLQSSSMEPTFHSGNIFLMNKVEIGQGKSINNPNNYHRVRGFKELNYGNVIVFYFPEADTIFIDNPKVNYHFKKRETKISGKPNKMAHTPIEYSPVNKRPRFIKRIIALPGDTLKIINGDNYINGKPSEFNSIFINKYTLLNNTPKNIQTSILNSANSAYTEEMKQIIEIQEKVVHGNHWEDYLEKEERPLNMPDPYVFPFNTLTLWNASYWGPAVIPSKGLSVNINENNISLYWRIIEAYEENDIELKNGKIYINKKLSNQYTFKMNYYWVAGDNRPHSFDSRYWGFVPESHIIGVINKLPFTK